MTTKSSAGVLALHQVYLRMGNSLNPVNEAVLNMSKKQIAACLSFALTAVRKLHIRLNEWDRIEIDINEIKDKSLILDVNFILKGKETHRVLDIKIEKGYATQFTSVSVAA